MVSTTKLDFDSPVRSSNALRSRSASEMIVSEQDVVVSEQERTECTGARSLLDVSHSVDWRHARLHRLQPSVAIDFH